MSDISVWINKRIFDGINGGISGRRARGEGRDSKAGN